MSMHIQTMTSWLLQVVKELHEMPHTPALQNGRRMASVLSLMLCFYHLYPTYINMASFNVDEIALMISMLRISPDVRQRQCVEYDYVNKMIQPQDKKHIADTILMFCNQLHHTTFFVKIQWLYAIPLLHFLQGVSQPFGIPELNPHEMKWGDLSLGLYNLRQQTYRGDFK